MDGYANGGLLPSTLVELLRWRALRQQDQVAYTFLGHEDDDAIQVTYGELDRLARAVAVALQERAAPGARVLLVYPPSIEYLVAFFGSLYAGMIAIPTYPPALNRPSLRLQAIIKDSQAQLALTTDHFLQNLQGRLAFTPELSTLQWITTDDNSGSLAANSWQPLAIADTSVAFLQYTSGSTAAPKGVVLTHRNLLHNLSLIHQAFHNTSESCGVIWLPPYHDMGLIGGILQPLYAGVPMTLMSPTAFLQRPLRWLELITRTGATTSGGPNFAYDLCAQRITAEQRATLDLSSWQVAFVGSEPVRPQTLQRFVETFAPCGFRREAFYPCYGLAEATLFVTGGHVSALPVVKAFEAPALQQHRVVPVASHDAADQLLVGCGQPSADQQLMIVDPVTRAPCLPDVVGEIWVAGPSVAQGYWGRVEETAHTFQALLAHTQNGPFLRTGDLGFIHEGELFITGRLKDLIIIRGSNLYPQDIEHTVEQSHPALRPAAGAAFSVDIADEERLVVVQEVERHARNLDVEEVAGAVRQAVAEHHGVQVYSVVLIRTGSIPKTSSGKIQRHACREQFLADALRVVGQSVAPTIAGAVQEAELTREMLQAAPADHAQRLLADYLHSRLAQMLGVDPQRVDRHTPINTLGIDSVMAVELQYHFETSLKLRLPMTSLLEGASIASVADELIAHDHAMHSWLTTAEGAAASRSGFHPVSWSQQALWFASLLAPTSAAYNIFVSLQLPFAIDELALQQAFQTLVQRHPMLRTTYTEHDGQVLQHVQAEQTARVELVPAHGWSNAALDRWLAVEADRPFDLEHGPVIRAYLVARSADMYVLALTMHHIAGDLWSVDVLTHELGQLYMSEQGIAQPALPDLPIQYIDYARHQRELLAQPAGERLRAYWLDQLAGLNPLLSLPTDRPRPLTQTYQGANHTVDLDEPLTRSLRTLAQAEGATLYSTLLAAFQVLLHRYTGAEEIVVGSPVAGRSSAELEGIVGCFVNHLVLRADTSRNPSFTTFLSTVRQTVLAALAHQEYPFSLLVEQLQPARDSSYSPVFQVAFVWGKTRRVAHGGAGVGSQLSAHRPAQQIEWAGHVAQPRTFGQRGAAFDLTLTIFEEARSLSAVFQYNTDLFDAATIERLAEHFTTLLHSITADPSCPIRKLPCLTAAEQQQAIAPPADLRAHYPDACIHTLFETQAGLYPNELALRFEAGTRERVSLTYQELNAQSNQVAHGLQVLGVVPGQPVAVLLNTGFQQMAALLGVLKLGGVLVCLDPNYPQSRLEYMIGEAAPPIILTEATCLVQQAALFEELRQQRSTRIVVVDEPDPDSQSGSSPWRFGAYSQTNLDLPVDPAAPAYIVYTSGSTGQPKGVVQSHRSFCQFMMWQSKQFNIRPAQRFAQWASITYDASYCEIFGTLCFGATLCLAHPSVKYDPARLVQWLRDERITILQVVPSFFRQVFPLMIEHIDRDAAALSDLECVLLAGEAMPVDFARQWLLTFPSRPQLYNLYGPTESVLATYYLVAAITPEQRSVPIGRPIDGRDILILDHDQNLCPIGVQGELYIRSGYLTLGYFQRPHETEQAFLQNPLHSAYPDPVYRTRDLGRWLSDGTLEFYGRIDNQVKIRGMRVELDEIAAVLSRHEAVDASAVVLHTNPEVGDAPLLCAYLVARMPINAAALRAFLRESLPEHMVPVVFVALDALPRTPNGKIDRRALPRPALETYTAQTATEAPATPLEIQIAEIWQAILGGSVGVHDSFFDLGGHSLLATQVVNRIRSECDVELTLQTFFETCTVARLARWVETAQADRAHSSTKIPRLSRDTDIFPLSFAQQRLWIPYQLEPESTAYNMVFPVQISGPLNIGVLEQSINEIVRRHEILRTRFAERNGEPVQIVALPAPVSVPIIDLQGYPPPERESRAMQLVLEDAQLRFDLYHGPVLRITLFRLSSTEHIILLTKHHIISDGWSMAVIVQELSALYEAFAQSRPSPLPELPIQYVDYASWHRAWLQSGVMDAQLRYWQRQLSDLVPLRLPTDRPRPALQTFVGARQPFMLPAELAPGLKTLCRAEDATLFMGLFTTFVTLIHRYTGQDDIVLGSDAAGRTHGETEGLIGFFANQMVLRTDCAENPSFRTLLRRVRTVILEAYINQDVPFDKVVAALKPERDLSRTPLFQVKFGFLKLPLLPLDFEGLRMQPLELSGTSKFDLELSLWERSEQVGGFFEYNTDLFNATTIATLAEHFEALFRAVVADPDQRLLDIPLLASASSTPRSTSSQESIHDQFSFDF